MEPEPPDSASVFDERGVDRSLVRWMLSLTPAQRLEAAQSHASQLAEFRLVNSQPPRR